MEHPHWRRVRELEDNIFDDYKVKEIGIDLSDPAYALKKAFWSGALHAVKDIHGKRETIKMDFNKNVK